MNQYFDEMFKRASAVRKHAHVPYVNFKVGVCLRAEDDTLYVGCNFQNSSLPHGQCAESNAIGAMISHGQQKIAEVVVVADSDTISPCGGCRQQLSEFTLPGTPVHLCNLSGLVKTITMSELMPLSFSAGTMEKNK